MEFAIYTYGGGEVYWKVFNGIALLFKHENQFMTLLIKLCMTIGVTAAGLGAILRQNGSQFVREWLIPSFMITSLLIFPETQVHIIDEVDLDHKYSKVDHVPVGLAAAVSLTSMISKGMVEAIEDSLGVDESLQYSKVGPMFAAKLVAMSRDVQIKDPIMRENIKDFMRQCFMWPYVFTNISPGRKVALESRDILKFIILNSHPSLGTYWRNPEGSTEFVYCGQCAKRVKEVLDIEKPRGLQLLATSLLEGNDNGDGEQATRRLKRYFGHAWETLAHQTAEAHEVVGQQMLINAYREGLDDKREEFGLNRINPQLLAYSVARANAQQNNGFLMVAQNIGRLLPSTQAVFLAFICLWFLFIAPLSLLPGGTKRLSGWFNMLLSVQLWPVFSALLNSVSLYYAAKAGAQAVMGVGGLSILTQNGLADAAYDAWCYTESLQASIPLISYAVISGSGYALTSLFTSPHQAVQSAAARMGAEAVDGNLSFDQQSFHNRSVASNQVAQQQLSPNIGFGSRIDDGKMAITHGVHGETTFTENLSSLQNNVSANDNIALTASENSQRSLQAAHSSGTSAMNSAHDTINWMKNFGDSLSKNQGLNAGYGSTKTAQLVKDASESRDQLLQLADESGIGHDKAFEIALRGGAGFVGGGQTWSAREQEFARKSEQTGIGKRFSQAWSSLSQHAVEDKAFVGDQYAKQAAFNLQGAYQKMKQYQDQANAHYTDSVNWSKVATVSQSSGLNLQRHLNDEILSQLATTQFGGNLEAAARWQSTNPAAYQAVAQQNMQGRQASLAQFVGSAGHILSEQEILNQFSGYQSRVSDETSFEPLSQVNHAIEAHGMGPSEVGRVIDRVSELKGISESIVQQKEFEIDRSYEESRHQFDENQLEYTQEKSRMLAGKTIENVATSLSPTKQDLEKVYGRTSSDASTYDGDKENFFGEFLETTSSPAVIKSEPIIVSPQSTPQDIESTLGENLKKKKR